MENRMLMRDSESNVQKSNKIRNLIGSIGLGTLIALGGVQKSYGQSIDTPEIEPAWAPFSGDWKWDGKIHKDDWKGVVPRISKNDIERELKKIIDNSFGKNGLGALGTKIYKEFERFHNEVGREAQGLQRILDQAWKDTGNGLEAVNNIVIRPAVELQGDVIQELSLKSIKLILKETLRIRCRIENGSMHSKSKDKNHDGLNDDYMDCWNKGISGNVGVEPNGDVIITYDDPSLPSFTIRKEGLETKNREERERKERIEAGNRIMEQFLSDLEIVAGSEYHFGSELPKDFLEIPIIELTDIQPNGKITINGREYSSLNEYKLEELDKKIKIREESLLTLRKGGEPDHYMIHNLKVSGIKELTKYLIAADLMAGFETKALTRGGKVAAAILKQSKSASGLINYKGGTEETAFMIIGNVIKGAATPEFTLFGIRMLVKVQEDQEGAISRQDAIREEQEILNNLIDTKNILLDYEKETPLNPIDLNQFIEEGTSEASVQQIPREIEGPRYEEGRGWIQAD